MINLHKSIHQSQRRVCPIWRHNKHGSIEQYKAAMITLPSSTFSIITHPYLRMLQLFASTGASPTLPVSPPAQSRHRSVAIICCWHPVAQINGTILPVSQLVAMVTHPTLLLPSLPASWEWCQIKMTEWRWKLPPIYFNIIDILIKTSIFMYLEFLDKWLKIDL